MVQETAQRLGVKLIFLPPYSPNLNLIERMWRFVKNEVLYNEFYTIFQKVKKSMSACLKKIKLGHNEHELQSSLNLQFQTYEP